MSIPLKLYLSGLKCLKEEVKADEEILYSLDVIEMRLNENNGNRRKYGDTKENKEERAEILAALNEITRDVHNISFSEYCRQNKHRVMPAIVAVQAVIAPTVESGSSSVEESVVSSDESDIVQQTAKFLISVSEYVAALQENAQKARDVFNDDAAVDQEHCEDTLASFYLLDSSNFPEYNQSLYRAGTQLQHLIDQVSILIELRGICNDVDQPSPSSRKKMQRLIGLLDSIYYEAASVQTLLSTADVEIST